MTISFVVAGTSSASTTTIAPGIPAGLQTSPADLMLLTIVWRSTATAPAAPTGYTFVDQNQVTVGAEGADSGTVGVAVYQRIFQTGDAAPSIDVTGRNGAIGWITGYRRTAGIGWSLASTQGADSIINTSHDAPAVSDPGGTVGDWLLGHTGTNGDAIASTRVTFGATWDNCTLDAVRGLVSTGTTSGNDMRIFVDQTAVSAGDSATNPDITWFWGTGSTANHPASAVVYTRLRETVAAPTKAPQPISQYSGWF